LTARWPDVTCIVPAFDQPDLLARCLSSVAAQRDVALEVIVTDDSLGTGVRERVAALAIPGLRYRDGARSGNPVDNWNLGLAQARSSVCVVVHQDEALIDATYLRRALDRLADPAVSAVIGPTVVVGSKRPSRFARAAGLARALGRPRWLLPSLNWIGPTAAFVFRRGPLFDRDLVQLVDVAFYRHVLGTGAAAFLEGPCVGSLGHHDAQITARIDPRRLARREIGRLARGPELAFHRAVLALRAGIG
jgi:glycosyltransferase involved in cell wall biosynthesis